MRIDLGFYAGEENINVAKNIYTNLSRMFKYTPVTVQKKIMSPDYAMYTFNIDFQKMMESEYEPFDISRMISDIIEDVIDLSMEDACHSTMSCCGICNDCQHCGEHEKFEDDESDVINENTDVKVIKSSKPNVKDILNMPKIINTLESSDSMKVTVEEMIDENNNEYTYKIKFKNYNKDVVGLTQNDIMKIFGKKINTFWDKTLDGKYSNIKKISKPKNKDKNMK